jgi:hypothetical protein
MSGNNATRDAATRAAVRFVIEKAIESRLIEAFDRLERWRRNPPRKPLIHNGRKP